VDQWGGLMAFTNAPAILTQIKSQITTALSTLLPSASISLDEPLDLVYDNLPEICVYPLTENFVYDESFNSASKKLLNVRIEIRMKSGPASSVATPILNAIASNLKADLRLNGLVDYLELGSIQWANDKTMEGNVCGCSLDVSLSYLV
jgi:hypothetical protein